MKKHRLPALALTVALTFTGAAPAGAVATGSREETSRIIERVDETASSGLVRSHFETTDGEEISISKHPESTRSSKKAAELPSSYDSRETGVVTPIRDQGVTGGCWAFGALKSLESSSILKNLSTLEDTDYSENHLIWYAYNRLTDTSDPLYGDYIPAGNTTDSDCYNRGGNIYIAMAVLANWWGAVRESTAPFTADSTKELEAMAASMRSQDASLRTQSDIHLKEANMYDDAEISEIKQAVMDYGALDVALYYDNDNMYHDDGVTSAYETTYTSEYANHCVTIIGWDDSFNTYQTTAPGSGAWLIANSYGDDFEMSTDGYYWVSYYDTSLCEFCSLEAEETDQYNTNFQYDGMGWSMLYYDTEDIRFANVFTNTEDAPRQLQAAGFYTASDQQPYEIQVYRHVCGTLPTDGELVSRCSTSGTADWAGYHTVPLAEPIAVGSGETFSIVVTFPAEQGREVYVAVEGSSDSHSCHYNSSSGQSYIYFSSDNAWSDNTSYREAGRTYNMNNVCLKVLASTISQEAYEAQEAEYATAAPSLQPSETDPQSSGSSPAASCTPNSSSQAPTASFSPDSSSQISTASSQAPAASPSPTASQSPAASQTPAGSSATSKITVSLKKAKLTIGKGETVMLPIKVSPAASIKKLSFQSSHPKKVSVTSSGKITGKKTGKAKIRISASSEIRLSITIVVKKAPKRVSLTAKKATLKKGHSLKLRTRLSSGSASCKKVFASSRPKVASVNAKGKVTAKKRGVTWITVKTFNGKRGRLKIRVV